MCIEIKDCLSSGIKKLISTSESYEEGFEKGTTEQNRTENIRT